jgi:glycosyltransferase involved in cell wall biosynthesis
MLVGVDARALASRRGVARYTRRMSAALAALDGVDVRALVPGRRPVGALPGVELRRTRMPSRMLHMAGALAGRPRVDALLGDPDVTWLPAPAPVAVSDPYVLTVHDLSWEDRPGDFTAYERFWHRVARPAALARSARVVVCDAPAIAEQLSERWGVAARVVEPGVDHVGDVAGADRRDVQAVAPRPGNYVLYVGALEPRKGLDVLADAWARAQLGGVELLVAGEGREKVAGATHLGHVSDEELQSLYAGAQAVVLPSFLEGYGLPPREAAAYGTPSIVSDLPTLRLPGTLRVPPGDAGALADALRRLPAERARLVAELAPPRTWDAAARELRVILEEAAGKR